MNKKNRQRIKAVEDFAKNEKPIKVNVNKDGWGDHKVLHVEAFED